MMRLRKNHVCGFEKIIIDLSDNGKELHWATGNTIILLVSEICFLQKIENDIIYFSGYILNNSLVILFIVDFAWENLNNNTKIVHTINLDNQI